MTRRPNKYWQERAEQRMAGYMDQAGKVSDELAAAYRKAGAWIKAECDKIFDRFARDGLLTEQEAKNLLRTVTPKSTMDELVQALPSVVDETRRREILNTLNAPAYRYRIQRLERLQDNLADHLQQMAGAQIERVTDHLVGTAVGAYYRNIHDIQAGLGMSFVFDDFSTDRLNLILNQPWSGAAYSDRIWTNTQDLAAAVREELIQSTLTGRSYTETAKVIMSRMASGAMAARRLLYTESTYVANQAEIAGYEECGVERYRYVATLDMHTSEQCRAMDGRIFWLTEAVAGVNLPPLHPWCRSTTVAVFEDADYSRMRRRARDPVTGRNYTVPADMPYADWEASVRDKYGHETIDALRKRARVTRRAG